MNQETINAINQWASQIENAIVRAAPAVWSIAVHVKQADAIGALITNCLEALLLLVIAFIAYRIMLLPLRLGREADSETHDSMEWPGGKYYIGGVIPCIAIIIVSLCFAWTSFAAVAFDQWIWIGATNPGLAVSHDIIVKVLSP